MKKWRKKSNVRKGRAIKAANLRLNLPQTGNVIAGPDCVRVNLGSTLVEFSWNEEHGLFGLTIVNPPACVHQFLYNHIYDAEILISCDIKTRIRSRLGLRCAESVHLSGTLARWEMGRKGRLIRIIFSGSGIVNVGG